MSETRAAYKVTMQPEDELDALCAVVMGLITGPIVEIVGGKGINAKGDSILLPCVSTDDAFAMQAWAWLEENHPWKKDGDTLALMRYDDKPSVCRLMGYDLFETVAVGDTYPHAISLAILEVGKVQ